MTAENPTQKLLTLFVIFTMILLTGFTLDTVSNEALAGPADLGAYSKCSYTSGLSDSGYLSAVVYYPCQTDSGPFAATTLTGGYTNTKDDMYWLSSHLVTHGYIVIAMTPNNIYGYNSEWRTAHKAGINKLISENNNSSSPIKGFVNTSKLQVMGFSKGGGGTLLASSDLGATVASTQALAPYMDLSYNISGIKSPTICYTGTNDYIAPPSKVVSMFNALPASIDRTLAYFSGVTHLDWNNYGSYQDRFKTYVTSWMKVYLDGDTSYKAYIDGSQNWFYDFVQYETTSAASPSLEFGVNYSLINRNSGKLLVVQYASVDDGANVVQWPSNGYSCQKWSLEDAGDGYVKIKNANSGKYLEVSYADTSDGANIAQWGDTGHYCQHWKLQESGSGYYILINRHSGKAADVLSWSLDDGANVIQWPNKGGANQQWVFSK